MVYTQQCEREQRKGISLDVSAAETTFPTQQDYEFGFGPLKTFQPESITKAAFAL